MDGTQFDNVSRLFARRRLTRRQALSQSGVGLAAAGLAATGLTAAAQDATPEPGAPDAARAPEMLFVQSFQSGSIVPTEGADGRYTVTLEHGLGHTIYFSDRPDRIVGAAPTPQFLEGLGFFDDNPPNAALLVENAEGETDIAVVELFSPTYDEASHTATYDVAVLAGWEASTELGFTQAPSDLAALAPSFGAAHLFIDGCPDADLACVIPDTAHVADFYVGAIPSSEFGGWTANRYGMCKPSNNPTGRFGTSWDDVCNKKFTDCYNMCVAKGPFTS